MFIFKIVCLSLNCLNTIQESISMILSRCYTFIRMKWAKSPPKKNYFCTLKFQNLWVQLLLFKQVKEEKKDYEIIHYDYLTVGTRFIFTAMLFSLIKIN